jgi:hypothetical protein
MATKESILFVPGTGEKKSEQYLDELIDGICKFCQDRRYTVRKLDTAMGQNSLEIAAHGTDTKSINIQEVYWGDLEPRLSTKSLLSQLGLGPMLFLYWLKLLRQWRTVLSNKYIVFGILLFTFIMLFWYFSIVLTIFTAIGKDPNFLGFPLSADLANYLGNIGSYFSGWSLLLISSAFMAVFPVKLFVDSSFGSRAYLRNEHDIR